MKRIFTIVMAAAAFLGAVSCERQFEKTQLSPVEDCVAPVLSPVGNVVINQVNNKVEAVVFNWTPADFGAPVEVSYQLYMTFEGNEALIGQSYSNSLTVSKSDLNGVACAGVGVGKNETAEVGAYLIAAVNGTGAEPVRSNEITFSISRQHPRYLPVQACHRYGVDRHLRRLHRDLGRLRLRRQGR